MCLLSSMFFMMINSDAQNANKPLVVVAADKMNMMYIGIENPLSIAVAGINAENLIVSISNGTISGSNGKYLADVKVPGEVYVIVSEKIDSDKVKVIDSIKYRVERIPPPHAEIGRCSCIKGCWIDYDRGVMVKLDNFPYDIKFRVIHFELEYKGFLRTKRLINNENGKFTDKMIKVLKSLKRKQFVDLTHIEIIGPDALPREINGVHWVNW